MHAYYSQFLVASPDVDVAKSVLCALSIPGIPQGAHLRDLTSVTSYSGSEVKAALDFFIEKKLVVQSTRHEYEWVHELLASSFREFSASQIDPIRRDSIVYLAERRRKEPVHRASVRPEDEVTGKLAVIRTLFGIIVLIILVRTIAGAFYRPTGVGDWLGRMYAPFGIAQLAWAWFVFRLQHLFIRLREGALLFPWVSAAIGIACVAVTAVWPETWLLSIGAMAVVIGAKFCTMSWRRSLTKQAQIAVRAFGVNCLVVGLVGCGAIGAWFWSVWNGALTGQWSSVQQVWVPWTFSIIAVCSAIVCTARHARREALARWIGLVERSYR